MNKSDLKSGMRVVLRNGERYILVGKVFYCAFWGYFPLDDYDEQLKSNYNDKDIAFQFDIMEIHNIHSCALPLSEDSFSKNTLLWKRQELSEEDKKVIDAIKILYPEYKWIARGGSSSEKDLIAYTTKPIRENKSLAWEFPKKGKLKSMFENHCIGIRPELLQFIKWTDDEPYYIGD